MEIKRKLSLTISKKGDTSGKPLLVSGDLRVDFKVDKMIGDALNTARIQIYNLSPSTIQALSLNEEVKYEVELQVGSLTDPAMVTLFSGDLINYHNTPVFADNLTILWCWERGAKERNAKSGSLEPLKGLKVAQIAQALISNANQASGADKSEDVPKLTIDFSRELKGRNQDVVPVFYPAPTLGQSLQALLGPRSMIFTSRGSKIIVTNTLQSEKDNAAMAALDIKDKFEIKPLLLKAPVQFSLTSSSVAYDLSPNLTPLDVMYINYSAGIQSQTTESNTSLQLVDGYISLLPKDNYLITKVTHVGSLYTDDWVTNINGLIYSKNN